MKMFGRDHSYQQNQLGSTKWYRRSDAHATINAVVIRLAQGRLSGHLSHHIHAVFNHLVPLISLSSMEEKRIRQITKAVGSRYRA